MHVCGFSSRERIYLGVFPECSEYSLIVCAFQVYKRRLKSLVDLGDFGHVAERSTIHIVDANDMCVRSKRLQNSRGGSRSRGERYSECATCLYRGKSLLEGIAIGVARAGVLESLQKK